MRESNVPPAVTGAEPQITGEPDFDPTRPFWISSIFGGFFVEYADGEQGIRFGPFETSRHAEVFAYQLNRSFLFEHDHQRDPEGFCVVCGDLDREIQERHDREMKEAAEAEQRRIEAEDG